MPLCFLYPSFNGKRSRERSAHGQRDEAPNVRKTHTPTSTLVAERLALLLLLVGILELEVLATFDDTLENRRCERGCVRYVQSCFRARWRTWCLYLHSVHSRRRQIFFVVLAFLWNTGLVWPPNPDCLRSYRLLPEMSGREWARESTRASIDVTHPVRRERPCRPCTATPCA